MYIGEYATPQTRRQFRERQLRREFSQLPKETQEINGYWAWAVGQVTDELRAIMGRHGCSAIRATSYHCGEIVFISPDRAFERSNIPYIDPPAVAEHLLYIERRAREHGWKVQGWRIHSGPHQAKDRVLTFTLVRAYAGGLM